MQLQVQKEKNTGQTWISNVHEKSLLFISCPLDGSICLCGWIGMILYTTLYTIPWNIYHMYINALPQLLSVCVASLLVVVVVFHTLIIFPHSQDKLTLAFHCALSQLRCLGLIHIWRSWLVIVTTAIFSSNVLANDRLVHDIVEMAHV